MSLRPFLEECRARGEVVEEGSASSELEAASIIARHDGGPVVVIGDVDGKGIPVVSGLCGARGRIYRALGVDEGTFYSKVSEALRDPLKPRVVEEARFTEVDGGASVDRLPILRHYEGEGGRYITAGVVVARDPDGGFQNASIHRLMVLRGDALAIRLVPRHLYSMYRRAEERGVELGVAVVIGVHPAVLFAASCSPPLGVDELWVANRLMGGALTVARTPRLGLEVPSEAEIVIEGVMRPGERAVEGPFRDVTGAYDEAREQPVVRVLRVYMRRDPMYHDVLPASCEHRLLMGMPREVAIWEAVRMVVPRVRAVRLTPGGFNWLHAVVAIGKQWEGDGKNAIMAAFTGHPSLKHVVVVDEDVDVDDPVAVERAIALNVQGDEDIVLVRGARGSTLDPSSMRRGVTCKVGVDATRRVEA